MADHAGPEDASEAGLSLAGESVETGTSGGSTASVARWSILLAVVASTAALGLNILSRLSPGSVPDSVTLGSVLAAAVLAAVGSLTGLRTMRSGDWISAARRSVLLPGAACVLLLISAALDRYYLDPDFGTPVRVLAVEAVAALLLVVAAARAG